jgi:hypothetical protein
MSRRTTWLVVLGVAALLIALSLKYGVKRTINGVDVNDQTEKDYAIVDAADPTYATST